MADVPEQNSLSGVLLRRERMEPAGSLTALFISLLLRITTEAFDVQAFVACNIDILNVGTICFTN